MNTLLRAFFLLLLASNLLCAETIRVPADQPRIQAAIDIAKPGTLVVVSEGTYKERITLKPGVRLVSEGDDTAGKLGLLRAERTVIDGSGDQEGPGIAMAEGATIDGFTVTKVGSYDDALWKRHWEERGENQDHAHIGEFAAPGIGADGVSCRIINCIVHHNGNTGIALQGSEEGATDPIVKGNVTYRNMGGGIGLLRGVGGIVRGNTCFENFYAGIGHSEGAVPLVVGNTCHGNIRAGIGVSEGSSPIVRNNDCYANRRAGIGIRTGAKTRPVVEGNHCHENGMAGIGSKEEAEPIIRNNVCEKNAMAGIGAQLEAKPLIVGNHCRSNQAAGIGLRPGCHGILWRNRCEDNKLVAIGLPQGAQALIAENVLSRKGGMPPLVAIRGGSRAIFSNNKLDGGGVAGILIEGSAILTGNTIVGHNEKFGQGIWLWKGSRALGEENKIEGFKNTVSVSEGASWTGARP